MDPINQAQLNQPKYTLSGKNLIVELNKDSNIVTKPGSMAWMTPEIKMETFERPFKNFLDFIFHRKDYFINKFSCPVGVGVVALSPAHKNGQIIGIQTGQNLPEVLINNEAFFVVEGDVKFEKITFTKIVGLRHINLRFYKLSGEGLAHIASDGDSVVYTLREGEEMIIDESHLLAFDSSVNVSFQRVKEGMINILFGGEGLFVSRIKGPGRVWVQSSNTLEKSRKPDFITYLMFGGALILLILAIIF